MGKDYSKEIEVYVRSDNEKDALKEAKRVYKLNMPPYYKYQKSAKAKRIFEANLKAIGINPSLFANSSQ